MISQSEQPPKQTPLPPFGVIVNATEYGVEDDGKRDDKETEADQRRLRDASREWHLVDQLLH
jgi:hypothetical protein